MSSVGARILKSSNRFTAYSSHQIELKLSRMILDINLLSRYRQDVLGTGEVLSISKFLQTSFVHVLSSRSRRNLSVSPRSERRPQRPFGAILLMHFLNSYHGTLVFNDSCLVYIFRTSTFGHSCHRHNFENQILPHFLYSRIFLFLLQGYGTQVNQANGIIVTFGAHVLG